MYVFVQKKNKWYRFENVFDAYYTKNDLSAMEGLFAGYINARLDLILSAHSTKVSSSAAISAKEALYYYDSLQRTVQ